MDSVTVSVKCKCGHNSKTTSEYICKCTMFCLQCSRIHSVGFLTHIFDTLENIKDIPLSVNYCTIAPECRYITERHIDVGRAWCRAPPCLYESLYFAKLLLNNVLIKFHTYSSQEDLTTSDTVVKRLMSYYHDLSSICQLIEVDYLSIAYISKGHHCKQLILLVNMLFESIDSKSFIQFMNTRRKSFSVYDFAKTVSNKDKKIYIFHHTLEEIRLLYQHERLFYEYSRLHYISKHTPTINVKPTAWKRLADIEIKFKN